MRGEVKSYDQNRGTKQSNHLTATTTTTTTVKFNQLCRFPTSRSPPRLLWLLEIIENTQN